MGDADPDLALSCPICMEIYSETRYPIAPYCGHSICKECGDKRKSNECVTCLERCFYDLTNKTSPWPSNEWRKNFALSDLVNLHSVLLKERDQFKSQYERAIPFVPNDIDFMECSKCKTMEKREKLTICKTCVMREIEYWQNVTEERLLPFIMCAFCCQEDHKSHVLTKYLPWKLDQLCLSTVSVCQSTVFAMDEACAHELKKGKRQLVKWNEKMETFSSLPINTYRDGLSIVNTLKMESDLLTRYSEDCLPPLRKYRKVVTDASSRLDKFIGEIKQGKTDSDTSEAMKEVEQITNRLEEKSTITVKTDDRKLESKGRDKQVLLPMSAEHVQRLPTTVSQFIWITGPAHVDRLYISVSHKMELLGVEMYRKWKGPEGTKGCLRIFDQIKQIAVVEYTVLEGSQRDAIQLVLLQDSVKLSPSTNYLLQLTINENTSMYYGSGGLETVPLRRHTGCTVKFAEHPGKSVARMNNTDVTWGQFAGFFIRLADD